MTDPLVRACGGLDYRIWPGRLAALGSSLSDLGADYFARRLDPERETRRLIARLEALGHHVTLGDTAA